MDSSYYTNPLVFLIQIVFELYLLIVILRFLLQVVRADFYNPISQFIVRATTPALRPIRSVIPGFGGLDISSLVLAWLIKALELFLIILISGKGVLFAYPLVLAIPGLVELVINIFLFSILILVIISWVSPGSYSPATGLLYSLTDPLMQPARRLLPSMGGLDLSPMIVMVLLSLLKMLLIPPLEYAAARILF